MSAETLSVRNITKSRPRVTKAVFLKMKNAILGKKYELSLAFVSSATSKKLNKTHRGKNKSTNVLSFSLGKNEGEIVMDLSQIKKETDLFDRSFKNLVAFLFIHALFHLKGLRHGGTMESKEVVVRKRFKV